MKILGISTKSKIIIALTLGFFLFGCLRNDENGVNEVIGCNEGVSGIYLYSINFFSGRCTRLTEDARDLSEFYVGDNSINSVKIVGDYMVTLFENRDFNGLSTTFTENDYSLHDNEIGSFTASSARVRNRGCFSSMNFSGDPSRILPIGVYVFDKASFEGNCDRIDQDAPDMSQEFLGDNTVRSLYINGSYVVILFEEKNFLGAQSIFHTSTHTIERVDDESATSSIKIFEIAPNCDNPHRPGVYLYEEPNFVGRCSKFLGHGSDLELFWIGENNAASVRIIGDLQARLFNGKDFTGDQIEINDDISDLNNTRFGRNIASSIRVTEMLYVCRRDFEDGVYLFSEVNTGDCTQFTEDDGNLSNDEIGNDTASSILIIGDYQATLYESYGMGGPSTTFTSSDNNFLDDDIGDNRTSSIEVQAPYPENEPVLFVEIHLETADIENAGTDDNVYVSLNKNNSTLLNYPRNDFERGDSDRYHLSNKGIREVKDIHSIFINKDGNDGWCISKVELIINEWSVFSETYNPCIWLDNDDGHDRKHTIRYLSLRGLDGIPAKYPAESVPIERRLQDAIIIKNDELVSIIQSEVGNRLIELPPKRLVGSNIVSSVFWGHFYGDPVEVTNLGGTGSNRLHVDLDLGAEVKGPNPDVDVDFDIVFGCSDGIIRIAIEDIEIKTSSFWTNPFVPDDFPLEDVSVATGSTSCPMILLAGGHNNPSIILLPGQ
jgi:hypothetical protein